MVLYGMKNRHKKGTSSVRNVQGTLCKEVRGTLLFFVDSLDPKWDLQMG